MTSAPDGRVPAPARPVPPPQTRLSVRLAALQAAATFSTSAVETSVLSALPPQKVAAALERWLLEAQP